MAQELLISQHSARELLGILGTYKVEVQVVHIKGLSYPKLSRTPEHAAYVQGLAPKHATFFGAWQL